MIILIRKLSLRRIQTGFLTILFAVALAASPTSAQFFQGFETDSVWGDPGTDPTRVATGSNGVPSRTGGFHAEVEGGDFTRWGGYSSVFPANGYTTSIAVYLNMAGGYANDTKFNWTSAINNTGGTHRRDFIFHGGFFDDAGPYGSGPRFVFTASHNSPGWPRNPAQNPVTVTTTGWYQLKHTFYDGGAGQLAVKMDLINPSGIVVGTWTLSDPSDIIGSTVGGNRYGWMIGGAAFQFTSLAIDDSELEFIPAQAVITVNTASSNGWVLASENTAGGSGAFVHGPGTPPLGSGSARLQVPTAANGYILAREGFGGTRLDQITSLSYSTYRTSSGDPAQAPSFFLTVDADVTDANTTFTGRLTFEPYHTETVNTGVWQTWNPFEATGNWWFSNSTLATTSGCTMATPCSLEEVLTAFPNAGFRNTAGSPMGFKVGSGWAGFDGNVDNLHIGIDHVDTVFDFEADPILVDDNATECPTAVYTTIQAAIAAALPGETIRVCAGTYNEDVLVNKSVRLIGDGPTGVNIVGPIGGDGATVRITGNNVELEGFTITRAGNNTTDWNNGGLNFAGIAMQGLTILNANIHNNVITGNRTGIDLNNTGGHTITRNIIDNNHTGMIMRNQTDNLLFEENFVTNNRTVGILFLDASGGSNVPVQTCSGCTFSNNNISGNWYGGIEDRQSGGSLPAPGTSNLKDFSGNSFDTTMPAVSTVQGGEPGYSALIPVAFGGTATNPGGADDIKGSASANVDYTPFLVSNVDTQPGTPGFQGDFSDLIVHELGAQVGATGRIQEGIDLSTGTVRILGGTYAENVDATGTAVTLSPGASPGQVIINGDLTLDGNDTLAIEIDGTDPATQYDNFVVTGSVTLGGAALALTGTHVPTHPQTFTIINNDAADPVSGTFSGLAEGSVVTLNAVPLNVSYVSGPIGGGNDVTLSTSVGPCISVTTAPHIDSLSNVDVTIPVTIGDTTGRQMTGAQFIFTYDPSVLSSNPVNISVTNGTVAPSPLIVVNSIAPGVIQVSISSVGEFSGGGRLVNINMKVVGPIGSNTPTTLSNVLLFKVDPQQIVCATVTSSDLTVISAEITGNVTYKLERFAQPTVTQPVPLVTITATGPTPLPTPAVTNAAGNYTMDGFGFGPYSLTPSKPDKICGAGPFNGIGSNDATLIARYVVQLDNLSTDQQEAAQVANLGFVNSLDASLVARFAVCINTPGSLVGDWRFRPLFTPAPGPINTVEGGAYNYFALLMGDVTGDWSPTGPLGPMRDADAEKDISVKVPKLTAQTGSLVEVPITFENVKGRGIGSYQFDVTYDPAVLEPAEVAAMLESTMGESLDVVSNSPEPGLLKVAVWGVLPVTGDGTYANLKFNVIGETGSSTPIEVSWFEYNNGDSPVLRTRGSLSVAESSGSVLKGRLITSTGHGIRSTRVMLTSDSGETSFAVSNALGWFEFGSLTKGRSYTISAQSKRYRFAPQVVGAVDSVTEIQMIAVD